MRTHRLATFITDHRLRLACIALWLVAAAPGSAQTRLQTGVQIEMPLLTFFTGDRRAVKVTVTEVGGPSVQSQVTIVYRDAANRAFARQEGVLTPSRPVAFQLPLTMSGEQVQLRASISIVGAPDRLSSPIVVLEDIDPLSLAIEQRISCAPPASREGPVTPDCPEVVVSSISIGG